MPLDILAKTLGNLGDFPYKDPSQVQFKKPALFIRGTDSTYVPDEVIPLIGQFFPLFELADVEGGHWLISENPEAFRQGQYIPLMAAMERRDLTATCTSRRSVFGSER